MDSLTDNVFGGAYAGAYDAFYADKDYESECDLVEALIREYGSSGSMSILDMGCGTGNHALPLARRGHRVVGVDRSKPMLRHARMKASDDAGDLEFHHGDIRDIDLQQRFDVVIILFAVLGYQIENEDVVAALQTARRHLKPDGLLMFDVWHGPAVIAQKPGQRVKTVPCDDGQMLRAADSTLDTNRHRCTVDYQLWHMQQNRLVHSDCERHEMRFFFPQELALFLQTAGFEMKRLGAFPCFNSEPDESTWNVMCVARAIPTASVSSQMVDAANTSEVGW